MIHIWTLCHRSNPELEGFRKLTNGWRPVKLRICRSCGHRRGLVLAICHALWVMTLAFSALMGIPHPNSSSFSPDISVLRTNYAFSNIWRKNYSPKERKSQKKRKKKNFHFFESISSDLSCCYGRKTHVRLSIHNFSLIFEEVNT